MPQSRNDPPREPDELRSRMEHVRLLAQIHGIEVDEEIVVLVAARGDNVERRHSYLLASHAACGTMGVRFNFANVKAFIDG